MSEIENAEKNLIAHLELMEAFEREITYLSLSLRKQQRKPGNMALYVNQFKELRSSDKIS